MAIGAASVPFNQGDGWRSTTRPLAVVRRRAQEQTRDLAGPGEGHVEQTSLLGPGVVVDGVDDGHEPFLQARDADRQPLGALGSVEGGELDGVE